MRKRRIGLRRRIGRRLARKLRRRTRRVRRIKLSRGGYRI